MSDNFHKPHSFDGEDDYVPFKHGEMKRFKKRLKNYADANGLTAAGKREWRAGNAPSGGGKGGKKHEKR